MFVSTSDRALSREAVEEDEDITEGSAHSEVVRLSLVSKGKDSFAISSVDIASRFRTALTQTGASLMVPMFPKSTWTRCELMIGLFMICVIK